MTKINTNGWKEFRLDAIFEMRNTKSIVQKNVVPDSGITPYVTASSVNNGVMMYIDCPKEWIDDGMCIMIGGKTMTFSYQSEPFCSNDSHNIALYLKDKEANKETTNLFLITVLRATLYNKYSWDDSVSMRRIKDESMFLPVTDDGKPDFAYMDSYMQKVMEVSEIRLENLRRVDKSKNIIDVNTWSEFWLHDLFEFKLPCGDLQVKQVETGNVPLITPSAFNNGLLKRISSESKSTIFPANTLTVDMFGNAYFHEEDYFVTAHGHVNVLLPKFLLNKYNGMFIATSIRAMLFNKYGFSEMCTQKVLKYEKVKLPSLNNGTPNLYFMESYMRDILNKSSKYVDVLSSVIF